MLKIFTSLFLLAAFNSDMIENVGNICKFDIVDVDAMNIFIYIKLLIIEVLTNDFGNWKIRNDEAWWNAGIALRKPLIGIK